jgi:hypothetical protein
MHASHARPPSHATVAPTHPPPHATAMPAHPPPHAGALTHAIVHLVPAEVHLVPAGPPMPALLIAHVGTTYVCARFVHLLMF